MFIKFKISLLLEVKYSYKQKSTENKKLMNLIKNKIIEICLC